ASSRGKFAISLGQAASSREGFAIPPGLIAKESVIPDDYLNTKERDCKSLPVMLNLFQHLLTAMRP
ncbi:MAG TPA: hypothetical protein PLP86_03415, partial [Armatimonadota bacterium]|nr:hypothetical protein [Armatimonadota bacterium]